MSDLDTIKRTVGNANWINALSADDFDFIRKNVLPVLLRVCGFPKYLYPLSQSGEVDADFVPNDQYLFENVFNHGDILLLSKCVVDHLEPEFVPSNIVDLIEMYLPEERNWIDSSRRNNYNP